MSQTEPRRRMRGSDAMFLYFERKEMPLHIGSVAVLDGPFDEESEKALAARLPELPRYRQRVMFSPMNLTHPSWEYDPDFDIRNHIRRVRLDPPGTEDQLSKLAGEVFTPLMDRNRPLWDLTVIDGLQGDRSGLILRVHHCMVDGVSGIALMNVMFDPSRTPRHFEPRPYNPAPLPDSRQLLAEGLAAGWAEAAERLIGAELNILRIAQAFLGDSSKDAIRSLIAAAPDLIRPTEKLPFNGSCSGVRGHCWTSMPFAEARAIRGSLGGTINDVVLAIVTGAVSRYVVAHRESLKSRFVRMMVPVNLRTDDGKDAVGNNISMLPLSVPLDIEDPAERMKAITLRSSAMKSARIADLVSLIGTSLGWIPPGLQYPLAGLPFMPQPVRIVNMVCTNVPGPMVPLYCNGRELLTYYPHVPCGAEVGISVAISSYNQKLNFGVTYDEQAAPDGELFRDFLIEAREELCNAAGVSQMTMSPPSARPAEAAATAAAADAHRVPAESPAAAEPVVAADVAPAAPVDEYASRREPQMVANERAADAAEPAVAEVIEVSPPAIPEVRHPEELSEAVPAENKRTVAETAEESPPAILETPAGKIPAARNGTHHPTPDKPRPGKKARRRKANAAAGPA